MLSILTLMTMLALAFGMYPLLRQPLFEPRGMYGFGVFISYIGICIMDSKKIYWAKAVNFTLSWSFFVFSFTYGNALNVQAAYTDFRINMVVDALNDTDIFVSDNEKMVQLYGSIGLSPILGNMPQDYQMLNRLVPVAFNGEWLWGQAGFYYYYGIKNIACRGNCQ